MLLQGAFTADHLISWNTQGYLFPELECTTSADSQHFFPFSTLGDLWSLQDKLGLKPEDVHKLADAEVRLAKQPAPAAPVYDVVHPQPAATVPAEQLFSGAQAMHTEAAPHPVPMAVNHHVAAADAGWDAPPLDQQRGQVQQQPQHTRPNPVAAAKQQSALYDPIDDIIDEGPNNVAAVAPGERTLQPFTGMGAGAAPAAAPAVAPAPQYAAPVAGHISTHQAAGAVQDAMENLRVADAPTPAPVGRTKVAPIDLFGEQAPVQPPVQAAAQVAVAPTGNHAAEPAPAKRIAPSQLFAQFPDARAAQGSANGHAPRGAMAMHGVPVQPPAPPPRAAATPQAAAAPRWGGAQPVQPAKFDEIQAEEMRKRRQEDAAAEVAAKNQMAQAEAERARRAAWAAQPKPVNFRQIVEDDEECAADLEGGWCVSALLLCSTFFVLIALLNIPDESFSTLFLCLDFPTSTNLDHTWFCCSFPGEEEELEVQPMGYNPWQGQAALPADGGTHASTAHLGIDVFRRGVAADGAAAVPAIPPPPARAARTAAQVLGQDGRAAGVQQAPRRAAAANAAKPTWQANAGRPAEHVAPPPPPPAADMLQEPEPEILKNNPDFYEWCMQEMGRLQGDMNVLVVLLETGANCEIMDFARSNLRGDNIGAFVSEFIKRKAQAAAAKPAGRKRKGKGGAAAAGAAVAAPQAAPARGGARPVAVETAGDGWEAVGAKGKPKRKGGAGAAAQNGGQNMRLGGGAFAVLPSL